MATSTEISQRVSEESARRARLGVPAVASGVLYLLSVIILSSTLRGGPVVGVVQGLAPALSGQASPAISSRAAEVKFESHHAFGLIAASVLTSIAIAFLVMVLLFLLRSARFRRPQVSPSAEPLIVAGGVLYATLTIANEIVLAVRRHSFATGHDFSIHAVNAVTHNTAYNVLAVVTPLAVIVLVAGMIMTMVASVRVGLLPRWMGMVGGVSAVLLLLPAPTLVLIPSFWLVATGILLLGRWPKGDPPAWAAGQARPWPSPAEQRAEREQASQSQGKPKRTAAQASADVAPEPSAPKPSRQGKRRRKRGSRP